MRAADETGERVKALALNCREQCALCPVLSPCVTVNRAVYLGFRSRAAGHDLIPITSWSWTSNSDSQLPQKGERLPRPLATERLRALLIWCIWTRA